MDKQSQPNAHPLVLLTRPAAKSARLALDLAPIPPENILQSPLIDIVPTGATIPVAAGYIIGSTHGITGAVPAGARAYCVGEKTAIAAHQAGLEPVVTRQTARELFEELVTNPPQMPLLHLRGRHSRGALAQELTAAGVPCEALVTYDQIERPLGRAARQALAGERPLILPLYSPRTARLFLQQAETMARPINAELQLVALSSAVAQEVQAIAATRREIAPQPTGQAMIKIIHRIFNA